MKIYAYDVFEYDKGIILANSREEAIKIFNEKYPSTPVVEDMSQYWKSGCFIYEITEIENENGLFVAFPF